MRVTVENLFDGRLELRCPSSPAASRLAEDFFIRGYRAEQVADGVSFRGRV